MPDFSDAFKKVFLATKATTANANQTAGLITTAGISHSVLKNNTGVAATTYGPGSFGFFDASTGLSLTAGSIGSTAPKMFLASAALQSEDKIGQFHGGYQESNKSKDINVKYVSSWQKYASCTPRQHVLHVGNTKYTDTLSPTNSACDFDFACGQNYNLRVEVRGTPAFHFMNRNIYRILSYDTGCCADGAVGEAIDGTLVMIEWANQIINDPELQYFVTPIVYSEAGVPHYPPGTTGVSYTWDNYVSPGHVEGQHAGMRLTGAYVDTVFGNCSFQPQDYYGKEPLSMIVSMVDFNGDPCAFTGICVVDECLPFQGTGYGETVLRDLILDEKYRQNNFPTDIRMREIELGDDVRDSVTRASFYTRYSLVHSIPRPNNPASTFSPDQYVLNIITTGTHATLETFMSTWLTNGRSDVSLETFSCGSCTPLTP